MTWKTLRCIVEIPVQGDFTETDLRYLLERMIGEGKIHARLNQSRHEPIATGRTRVMMFSKFMAAKRRQPLETNANAVT